MSRPGDEAARRKAVWKRALRHRETLPAINADRAAAHAELAAHADAFRALLDAGVEPSRAMYRRGERLKAALAEVGERVERYNAETERLQAEFESWAPPDSVDFTPPRP